MPEKNSSLSNTNSCWPADQPQIWRPLLTTGEASLCQNELICLTNGLLCTDGIDPSSLCVFLLQILFTELRNARMKANFILLHRFFHGLNLCRSLMPEKSSSLSNTNSCWPADLPQIWRPLLTTGEASLCQNELICLTNGLLCTDGIGPSSLCVFFTPDSVYKVKKCKNEGQFHLFA